MTSILDYRVKLLRKETNASVVGSNVEINATLDSENIPLFQELEEIIEVKSNGRILLGGNYTIGTKVEAVLEGGKGFYQDLNNFIIKNKTKLPNDDYYIYPIDYYSKDQEIPLEIISLKKIHKLIEFLKDISSYNINNDYKLIFVQGKATEINIDFKKEDLACELKNLDSIISELDKGVLHSTDKRHLFVCELINLFEKSDSNYTLSFLLNKWDSLIALYKDSYRIYAEEHSLSKIRSEFDKVQIEYIAKIKGILNDITTKALSIPFSIFIGVAQFDFTGENLKKNIVIVIGLAAFFVIEQILISNHKSQLIFLKDKILLLEQKYRSISTFTEDLNRINKEVKAVENKISIIETTMWIFIWGTLAIIFFLVKKYFIH